jgi:hypothetical protein
MDGVHVGSQPEAGIGECEPHRTQGFRERAEWAVRVHRGCLLEAQPPAGDPAEERLGKDVIVVARNDDDLGSWPEGLPDLAEERAPKRHGRGFANLAELEHIAEDHQPVEVAKDLE